MFMSRVKLRAICLAVITIVGIGLGALGDRTLNNKAEAVPNDVIVEKIAAKNADGVTEARRKKLMAGADSFRLHLQYVGRPGKLLYELFLHADKRQFQRGNSNFFLHVKLTRAEAVKLIDGLAKAGFLREAMEGEAQIRGDVGYVARWANASYAQYLILGKGTAMHKKLKTLRKSLTGDAAKAMDRLLGRLDVAPAKKQDQTRYKLPQHKDAEVLTLEYKGMSGPAPRNSDPVVSVRADGTVILGAPYGQLKRVEAKISAKELQELLHFTLKKSRLRKFDIDKVQQQIQAAGKPAIGPFCGPDTVVRVHADGKQSEARCFGLSTMAQKHKQIAELVRFEAVRKRLEHLRATIYAGGAQEIGKHLQLVNAELKRKHPDVPALKAKDLESALQRANGTAHVRFSRTEKLAKGVKRITSANVNYPAGGAPKVSVQVSIRAVSGPVIKRR